MHVAHQVWPDFLHHPNFPQVGTPVTMHLLDLPTQSQPHVLPPVHLMHLHVLPQSILSPGQVYRQFWNLRFYNATSNSTVTTASLP